MVGNYITLTASISDTFGVPIDLEADLSDSDNDIFIFIIGIQTTSRIELFILLCLDSSCFAVATEKGILCDMTMDYLSDKCTS